MTWEELSAKLYLQIDDSDSLSTAETLDLLNDVYYDICDDRNWSFLRKTATGTTSTSVDYVALPSDFNLILPNINGGYANGYNNLGVPHGSSGMLSQRIYTPYSSFSSVIVGTTRSIYIVIDIAQANNYYNIDWFCYIDIPNSRLVFTKQPTTAQSITYSYKYIPTAILTATSPIFPARFHKMIAFGAAAKFNNIEQTDKNQSYQRENQLEFEKQMEKLRMLDSHTKLTY